MFRGLYRKTKQETVTGLFYLLIAGILFILGQFVCGIISIIGWILAIIGFFKIYGDRDSYPKPHRINMNYSLVFYILGIVISIIGVIAIFMASFSQISSIFQNELSRSETFDDYITNLIIAIFIILIGSLCTIFARYKLLIELMPPYLKGFLKIVTVFTLIIILVGFAVLYFLFNGLLGTDDSNLEGFVEKANSITLTNLLLGLTTQILFLLCFYFAWSYQKTAEAIQRSMKMNYRTVNGAVSQDLLKRQTFQGKSVRSW